MSRESRHFFARQSVVGITGYRDPQQDVRRRKGALGSKLVETSDAGLGMHMWNGDVGFGGHAARYVYPLWRREVPQVVRGPDRGDLRDRDR